MSQWKTAGTSALVKLSMGNKGRFKKRKYTAWICPVFSSLKIIQNDRDHFELLQFRMPTSERIWELINSPKWVYGCNYKHTDCTETSPIKLCIDWQIISDLNLYVLVSLPSNSFEPLNGRSYQRIVSTWHRWIGHLLNYLRQFPISDGLSAVITFGIIKLMCLRGL